jgi:hypothetical protein
MVAPDDLHLLSKRIVDLTNRERPVTANGGI